MPKRIILLSIVVNTQSCKFCKQGVSAQYGGFSTNHILSGRSPSSAAELITAETFSDVLLQLYWYQARAVSMSLHVFVVTDRSRQVKMSIMHGMDERFQLDMDCCTFEMRSPPQVQRLLRINIYLHGNSLISSAIVLLHPVFPASRSSNFPYDDPAPSCTAASLA